MVELTPREKAIIHTMFFMMNPQTMKVPIQLRATALTTMLKIRKLNFEVEELQDFTHAIEQEQKDAVSEGFGFLNAHPEIMESLKHLKF